MQKQFPKTSARLLWCRRLRQWSSNARKKYVHPERQLLEESNQAAKSRPWSTVAPLPMQLENGSERGLNRQCSCFHKRKAMPQVSTNRAKCPAALMFSKIASDLTIPWLRWSHTKKGPLPEHWRRTNNLTARWWKLHRYKDLTVNCDSLGESFPNGPNFSGWWMSIIHEENVHSIISSVDNGTIRIRGTYWQWNIYIYIYTYL